MTNTNSVQEQSGKSRGPRVVARTLRYGELILSYGYI